MPRVTRNIPQHNASSPEDDEFELLASGITVPPAPEGPYISLRLAAVTVWDSYRGRNQEIRAGETHGRLCVYESFRGADLTGTTFAHCNFTGADFSHCDLTNVTFTNCSLIGTRFIGAILTGTVFTNGCHTDESTIWRVRGDGRESHIWGGVLTHSQQDALQAGYRRRWDEVCGECQRDPGDCGCSTDTDESSDDEELDSYSNLYQYNVDVIRKCGWPAQNAKNALVFGVELELEAVRTGSRSDHTQSTLVDLLGGPRATKFICKSDGSLTNGVELVTLPFTLDQHRKEFGWAELMKRIAGKAKSGAGTDHCGIHVHINRAALSPFLIGKMGVFANNSTMSALISAIAQRSANDYCSRDSKKKVTDGDKRTGHRYDILNIGPRTVEVRMFRGNLRPDRIIKNIEFCHSMVIYCRDCSVQELDSWSNYTQWLIKRRGEYPNLVRFLIEKRVPGFGQLVTKDTRREEEV